MRTGRWIALLLLGTGLLARAQPANAQWRERAEGTVLAGGLLGVTYLFDQQLLRRLRHSDPAMDLLAERVSLIGDGMVLLPALALTYGGLRLNHRTAAASAVERIGVAGLAAGVVSRGLKLGVGRARPDTGVGNHSFRPFEPESKWAAFPSGHTALLFATASALAAETDEPWIEVAAFSTATLVGLARVIDHQHWPSDVIAGALQGVAVSRLVYHLRARGTRVRGGATPEGLTFSFTF